MSNVANFETKRIQQRDTDLKVLKVLKESLIKIVQLQVVSETLLENALSVSALKHMEYTVVGIMEGIVSRHPEMVEMIQQR